MTTFTRSVFQLSPLVALLAACSLSNPADGSNVEMTHDAGAAPSSVMMEQAEAADADHDAGIELDGAPEADASVADTDPSAAPGGTVILRSVRVDDEELGPMQVLAAEGLPALSANGRYVLARTRADDYGNGELVVLHARSGREVQRYPWPQVTEHVEGRAGPIDWDQVHSVRRYLALHGFVPLTSLPYRNSDEFGGRDLVFSGADVEVAAHTPEGGSDTIVSVHRKGDLVFERNYPDEEIMAAAVSEDGTLLVLQVGFCGCHCRSTPTVVSLP